MASEIENDSQTGLREMVESLNSFKLRFALIGGLAVGYRSRPRFTRDIDFLLDVPQVVLPRLLGTLQSRGFSFDTEQVIREWTRDHFTVLSYHDVPIDWLKPILPLYRQVIERATAENLWGFSLPIASPDGLILTKLVAFRGQDQVDIENIVATNGNRLDLDFIRRTWLTVADEVDPRFVKFRELVAKSYSSAPPAEPPGG